MNNDRMVTKHVFRVTSGDMHVFLIVLPEGITLIDAGFPGTMALIEEALRGARAPAGGHPRHPRHPLPSRPRRRPRRDQAGDGRQGVDARRGRRHGRARARPSDPGSRPRVCGTGGSSTGWSSAAPAAYEPGRGGHTRCAPGETIPVAGGIKAIWTPGHSAGHLVFLWPGDGGVLFTGDAANNVRGLSGPPIFEDMKLGAREPAEALEREVRRRLLRPWRADRRRRCRAVPRQVAA